MTEQILTQKKLKELFEYNPETGDFVWRVTRKGRGKKNHVAGTVNSYGYRVIMINFKLYPAHRLIFMYMTGRLPKDQIDHINGVRTDHRWINLREVTQQENLKNKKIQKNNKTGINGVYKNKISGRWYTNISVNKRLIYLGSYKCLLDAVAARKRAEKKYHYHENHGRN